MRRLAAAWWLLAPLAAVAAFYAPRFGGFWLGDDWPNLHRAWRSADEGELWSQTWSEFVAPNLGGGSFLRPMLIASFSLSYTLFGTHYAGWYAFNFAVHLANVVLVAYLVAAWARGARMDGRIAAGVSAAAFGLSPLVAEGVYWVSARSDGWVTLCSLAALAIWTRDAQRGTRHGLVAYPALLLVALGFKESAAILPLQVALVALAWPGARPRALWPAIGVGLALLALYFVFRAWLFPNVLETYIGRGAQGASVFDRLDHALRTLPAWWAGFSEWRPRHAAAYGALLAIAFAIALAASRGAALRLGVALAGASAGLAAATLYHLGGMASNGEGGRLVYGPMAWLLLAFGVLLAGAWRSPRIARVAAAVAVLSLASGAAVLHVTLREVAWVQDNERALVEAFARWAGEHASPVIAIVPENHGPIVVYRNAQGGIVLPPVQPRGVLHLIVPALPRDLPRRYAELARGLGTRLAKVQPQKADAQMLREIREPDEATWPDVICWNPREKRLVALPAADHSNAKEWLGQTRAAARACLPDEPSFASP
jgi:hypothetical protein